MVREVVSDGDGDPMWCGVMGPRTGATDRYSVTLKRGEEEYR